MTEAVPPDDVPPGMERPVDLEDYTEAVLAVQEAAARRHHELEVAGRMPMWSLYGPDNPDPRYAGVYSGFLLACLPGPPEVCVTIRAGTLDELRSLLPRTLSGFFSPSPGDVPWLLETWI